MTKSQFNNLLADSISSLKSPSFTPNLMAFIASLVNYDCAVILGLRTDKHPIYLYDSIKNNRELLFDRYLTSAFQDDPFYKMLTINEQQGVFSLKDVAKRDMDYQTYCNQFYLQTGWKDELSILIKVEATRWVLIYLGCTHEDNLFSPLNVKTLKSYFSVIQSLCQQHWKQTEFLLAEPVFSPESYSVKKRKFIEDGLHSFGKDLLSTREKQIARLILQGLDTKEIAKQLGITEGTVKNHRKRIYAQLRVSSLSELFQIFLNHIITH
ncbi:response regulator transcription factor [Vibrio anguillarum]|uniref:response regulator transcription factor n=1 Tax=Vibrio anguillarum TaxID=55601 RepID=UPI00097E2C80|nr:helix-turn-helix transcriptional regulator [Vibrio anguillarum]AQM21387.1 helix-turn-helix transcriptional regulator [Vibrio anguillarum]MBT2929066.1 helix-turn-helix transcriptional regulator [Vibrio anguillarum]